MLPTYFRVGQLFACVIVCVTASCGFGLDSGRASSTDYSLDYATVAAGGGESSSTDYSAVTLLTLDGAVGGKTASSDYDTSPVVGTDITIVPVTMSEWSVD